MFILTTVIPIVLAPKIATTNPRLIFDEIIYKQPEYEQTPLQPLQHNKMSSNYYTRYSRKRAGFRINLTVGPRDIYQMRCIKNLKPADLDKIEQTAERNGRKILVERIEKDCNGVGNIIAWTNKCAFDDWHRKNDRLYDDRIRGTYSPTTDESHNSIRVHIHSSCLPLASDIYDSMYYASAIDIYDDEHKSTLYSSSQQNLGQNLLKDQNDLGEFGFLLYVYHPKQPIKINHPQMSPNTANTEVPALDGKRKRRTRDRLTYDQPGKPSPTK
jgi:hypothetical protein